MNQNPESEALNFRSKLYRIRAHDLSRRGTCLRLKANARNIAALLAEATGQHRFPVDTGPICPKMCIHTIVLDEDLSFTSELCPDEKGFTIRIRNHTGWVRTRAAIAHEIGHALFYDTTRFPPVRIFQTQSLHSKTDKEEWIAWDFARELLLPRKLVERELLYERYPSISKLLKISKACEVSLDLLLHRIIFDLNIWQNCAFFIYDLDGDKLGKTRVYRGREFPKFYLLGNNGLLKSKEFQSLWQKLEESQTLEEVLEFAGFQIWASLKRYAEAQGRVVGALEIPVIS